MTTLIEITVSGKDIRPETIKAGDVAEILGAIERMVENQVFAKYPDLDPEKVIVGLVNIRSSSLGLQFVSEVPEASIPAFREVGHAVSTRDFTGWPTSSMDALKKIVAFTRKRQATTEFAIQDGHRDVVATITAETKPEKRLPLTGETVIYGQVVRVGGKTPKVMIETVDGQIIYCDVEKAIAAKLGERLYRVVGLVGVAHWDTQSLKIDEFRVVGSIPYEERPLVDAMDELSKIAGPYYADVQDVAKYISDIRGPREDSG